MSACRAISNSFLSQNVIIAFSSYDYCLHPDLYYHFPLVFVRYKTGSYLIANKVWRKI